MPGKSKKGGTTLQKNNFEGVSSGNITYQKFFFSYYGKNRKLGFLRRQSSPAEGERRENRVFRLGATIGLIWVLSRERNRLLLERDRESGSQREERETERSSRGK